MSDEYIHIPRSVFERDWWGDKNVIVLYLYLLASANTEDGMKYDRIVKKGQVLTSLRTITADNPALTLQTIRTSLKKLKEAGEIKIETTSLYTIITIQENVEQIQRKEETLKDEPFVLTPDPVPAPTKPVKTKEQIIADTKKRMKKFYDGLIPYVEVYGKEMMREFYDYWSEMNKSQSKMRWENERTWNLDLRLRRWANNNKGYNNGNRTSREAEKRLEGAANVVNSFLSES